MPTLPFQEPVLLIVTDKHGAAPPPYRVAFWLVLLGNQICSFIPPFLRSFAEGERDSELGWLSILNMLSCLWFCAGYSAERVREIPA